MSLNFNSPMTRCIDRERPLGPRAEVGIAQPSGKGERVLVQLGICVSAALCTWRYLHKPGKRFFFFSFMFISTEFYYGWKHFVLLRLSYPQDFSAFSFLLRQ